MRHRSLLERTARTVLNTSKQGYVCNQCLAQARSRALHSSAPRRARGGTSMKEAMDIGVPNAEEVKRNEDAQNARIERILSGPGSTQKNDRVMIGNKSYELAEVYDPRINKDYVLATTLEELPRIGSEAWVKARADTGETYSSFIPKNKAQLSNVEWQKLLRHLSIVMLTLFKDGQSLKRYTATEEHVRTVAQAHLKTDGEGIEIVFAKPEHEKEIIAAATGQATQVRSNSVADFSQLHEQAKQYLKTVLDHEKPTDSKNIMQTPLADPQWKLGLFKNVAQLTGHRVPDLKMSQATTIGDIYHALMIEPAPKKLAKTKQIRTLKVNLPNVTVYETRRTPIHKEKEVGRWKVIEKELVRRDLPVTGTRWNKSKINQ